MSTLRRPGRSEPAPRKTQRRGPRPSPHGGSDWDQRYREGAHKWRQPDPFLPTAYRKFIAPGRPRPGRALDVAGGVGRHALWLARRGWQVTIADLSRVGLAEARRRARHAGVKLTLRRRDLRRGKLPRGRYDLVLVFFFLERKLFPALARALNPGGILLYKTYTRPQRNLGMGGPRDPSFLLRKNELRRAFPGLKVLSYREVVEAKAFAELVAQKA
ncbi:MAG TPA: methyltransferase domain-containing protein [Terriglobales bacterium]|nr:methyltransferase domain-containing protein [Terriglobales bacterium]